MRFMRDSIVNESKFVKIQYKTHRRTTQQNTNN